MTNEPVDQPAGTADAATDVPADAGARAASDISEPPLAPPVVAPAEISEPPAAPAVAAPRTGLLRVLSIIVIVAGAILMVSGVVTWFVVRDQLSNEKIVVSEDAPFLGGNDVNGPFSAYAQAEAINDHALEASGGLTYAELPRDDPRRDTVMTASFLPRVTVHVGRRLRGGCLRLRDRHRHDPHRLGAAARPPGPPGPHRARRAGVIVGGGSRAPRASPRRF